MLSRAFPKVNNNYEHIGLGCFLRFDSKLCRLMSDFHPFADGL